MIRHVPYQLVSINRYIIDEGTMIGFLSPFLTRLRRRRPTSARSIASSVAYQHILETNEYF